MHSHHIPNSHSWPRSRTRRTSFPLDIPFDYPALFNATVERFFRAPFVKKDRINDTLKSFEKLKTSLERPER
ncbi:MAG: hypothetical protein AABN34_27775 [Acidobacteriota bacterium]